MVPYESYVELAERLLAVTPIAGPKKAAFFNSGAEAVENAVKIAKQATGRSAVITFDRAFHGRTLMAMSLTSKQHPYKAGMGPFAPEVYRAPYPYPYRGDAIGPDRRRRWTSCGRCSRPTSRPRTSRPSSSSRCRARAGSSCPPAEWVRGLREIADEHGIVLIADEVQSGYGRTGRMFAIEHFGVEPDLITVAKSIAAGVPISGVIGRAEIVDRAGDSTIGGTYVGSPLGCVAGLAVLDEIENRDLLARGRAIGERMRSRFEAMQAAYPQLGDVRGLGPMLALEFVKDPETREPAPELATAVAEGALSRGLMILKAGIHGHCLRVLVALVATDEQIEESLDVFEATLAAVLPAATAAAPVAVAAR